MRYSFLKLLLVIVVGCNLQILAAENNFRYCESSPLAINNYEPLHFENSNNLLKRPGQEANYCGEAIIIYGRVLDQNCVPVTGVKVNSWQVNCNRKYPYQPLKSDIIKENLLELDSKLSFAGNGTAITNNKGEFYFITVYPPVIHEMLPHINIKLKHDSIEARQFRFTLKGQQAKNIYQDPNLTDIATYASTNNMQIYKFEIIIPAVQYRKRQD